MNQPAKMYVRIPVGASVPIFPGYHAVLSRPSGPGEVEVQYLRDMPPSTGQSAGTIPAKIMIDGTAWEIPALIDEWRRMRLTITEQRLKADRLAKLADRRGETIQRLNFGLAAIGRLSVTIGANQKSMADILAELGAPKDEAP